jgi:uncharacterized protein (DUF58 family)
MTTIDPFGIFPISRKIEQTATLMVYPSIVPIDRIYLPRSTLSVGYDVITLPTSVTTNAVSVREYRNGDSFRKHSLVIISQKGHANGERIRS